MALVLNFLLSIKVLDALFEKGAYEEECQSFVNVASSLFSLEPVAIAFMQCTWWSALRDRVNTSGPSPFQQPFLF
jgi:hypothetical protein